MKTVHKVAILDTLVDNNVVDVEKIVFLNDMATFQNRPCLLYTSDAADE